jgi:hypothetical protein
LGSLGKHGVRYDSYDLHILVVPIEVSPHKIRSERELAGEGLVDDDNMLCVRTVHVRERSARDQSNLQGFEIARRDINLVCRALLPSLLAISQKKWISQSPQIVIEDSCDAYTIHPDCSEVEYCSPPSR